MTLPTLVNLKLWVLSTSNLCDTSGKIANLKHILTGCQYSLSIYMWRHNKIFGIIADDISLCVVKDIEVVKKAVAEHERIAGAKVNFDKSEGLRLGAWTGRNNLPGPFC